MPQQLSPADQPEGRINTSISAWAGRGEQTPPPPPPPTGTWTVQGCPWDERGALLPTQPHVPLCSAEKLALLLSYIYLNVKSSA